MFYEVTILGQNPVVESVEVKEDDVEKQKILAEINQLEAQIALKKAGALPPSEPSKVAAPKAGNVGKGARAVKAKVGRMYVLLTKQLDLTGKVPQQQADLADILAKTLEVGVPTEESAVFEAVTRLAVKYPQLAGSTMHPTYLLAYYRGYDKKDGKHYGFIKRNFIRVIG